MPQVSNGKPRKILVYGSPALRQKAQQVSVVDDDVLGLIRDMLATILAREDALALAANQIGELRAVIVLNPRACGIEQDAFAVVNPEITEAHGTVERSEGCLSFPGVFEVIKRNAHIKARGLNEKGRPIVIDAEGTLARAIQHEIDHLNGILLIDHLSPTRRAMLKKTLQELEKSCA